MPAWEKYAGWENMDVEPKIGVGPPNHPIFNRVFHYFHHPFWGKNPPIFWFNTHILLLYFGTGYVS